MVVIIMVAMIIPPVITAVGVTSQAEEGDTGVGRRIAITIVAIAVSIIWIVVHVDAAPDRGRSVAAVAIFIVSHARAQGGGAQKGPGQR